MAQTPQHPEGGTRSGAQQPDQEVAGGQQPRNMPPQAGATPAGGPGSPGGRQAGGDYTPPPGGRQLGGARPRTPFTHGIQMSSGLGIMQRQVYYQQAPGVEGDFCDHNPRTTVNAGPGGLVAGADGIMIGRFCWFDPDTPLDPNDAPKIVLSHSDTQQPVVGFIHREQQGLITNWLGGSAMWIPSGFPVTAHQTGGFFVINRGDDRAELGMKVFAFLEDGSIAFAPAGGAVTDAVETKWFAVSQGDPGVLVKMSSWPLG